LVLREGGRGKGREARREGDDGLEKGLIDLEYLKEELSEGRREGWRTGESDGSG